MVQLKQLVGVVAAVFLFAFVSVTHAQNGESVVLATTEIKSAEIVEVAGNQVNIYFELYNAEGAQPGVKYAVNLVEVVDGKMQVVDEHVYTDSISIREGQTVDRTITYEAPEYLSGDYTIWLRVRNERDFPLAVAPVPGTLTFEGTDEYAALLENDCYLTVDQDTDKTKRYTAQQGVDILPTETLTAHCSFSHTFSEETTVYPAMAVYERSTFGPEVLPQEVRMRGITLTPGETAEITLPLNIATEPQSYDTALVFTTVDGVRELSSSVAFHYVVAGKSGTVQNTVFDKDYYAAGDTATLKVVMTGSADSFPGSRLAADTQLTAPVAEVAVTGAAGVCAATVTQAIDQEELVYNIAVPITSDCLNPTAAITMRDGALVLDEQDMGVRSAYRETASSPAQQSDNTLLFTVVTIAALLALIIVLHLRRRLSDSAKSVAADSELITDDTASDDGVALKALFLALVFGGSMLMPAVSDAATFGSGEVVYTAQVDVPWDPWEDETGTYDSGDTIAVTGEAQWASCGNAAGDQRMWMVASIDSTAGEGDVSWSHPDTWVNNTGQRQILDTVDVRAGDFGVAYLTAPTVAVAETRYVLVEGAVQPTTLAVDPLRDRQLLPYRVLPPNTPPSAPALTPSPSNNYNEDSPQCFTAVSTDPEGDQVRYLLDGNMNGTTWDSAIDDNTYWYNSGASGVVCTDQPDSAQGTTVTIQVKALDYRGLSSGWTQADITFCPFGEENLGSGCQPIVVIVDDGTGDDSGDTGSYDPAACGVADKQSYAMYDSYPVMNLPSGLCVGDNYTVGVQPSAPDGDLRWECVNRGDSTDRAACEAYNTSVVDGMCGWAAGKAFSEQDTGQPTDPWPPALCYPLFQTVLGASYWDWQCLGVNGGAPASCSATYVSSTTPPACGSATAGTYAEAPPEHELCAGGRYRSSYGVRSYWTTYSLLTGSPYWQWQCEEIADIPDPDKTVTCTADATNRILSVCADGVKIAEGDGTVGMSVDRMLNDGDEEELTVFYDRTPNDCSGFNLAQLNNNDWWVSSSYRLLGGGVPIVKEWDNLQNVVSLSNRGAPSYFDDQGELKAVKVVTGNNSGPNPGREDVLVLFKYAYESLSSGNRYFTDSPWESITLKYTTNPSGAPVPTAECGSAVTESLTEAPTTNLCAVGDPSLVTATGNEFRWECGGAGLVSASCSGPLIDTGVPALAVCIDDVLVAVGTQNVERVLYQKELETLSAYYDGTYDCKSDDVLGGDAMAVETNSPDNALTLSGSVVRANDDIGGSYDFENVVITHVLGDTVTLEYEVKGYLREATMEVCINGEQVAVGNTTAALRTKNDSDTEQIRVYRDTDLVPECYGYSYTATTNANFTETSPSTPGTVTVSGTSVRTVTANNSGVTAETANLEITYQGETAVIPYHVFGTGPNPFVELEVNGDSTGVTIDEGDPITLTWTADEMDSCTVNWPSMDVDPENGGTDSFTPTAGSHTYQIDCVGTDMVPYSDWVSVDVDSLADLTVEVNTSFTPDLVNGEYDSIRVSYRVHNNGGDDTSGFSNYLGLDVDGGGDDYSFNDSIPGIPAGSNSGWINLNFDGEGAVNIPIGANPPMVTVGVDNTNATNNPPGAVSESNENNNYVTVPVGVPAPNLQLNASEHLIRSGTTVELEWDVNGALFLTNCSLRGPNGYFEPINPQLLGVDHDSETSSVINKKTEFVFSCELAGVTFTATDVVEVTGSLEEI